MRRVVTGHPLSTVTSHDWLSINHGESTSALLPNFEQPREWKDEEIQRKIFWLEFGKREPRIRVVTEKIQRSDTNKTGMRTVQKFIKIGKNDQIQNRQDTCQDVVKRRYTAEVGQSGKDKKATTGKKVKIQKKRWENEAWKGETGKQTAKERRKSVTIGKKKSSEKTKELTERTGERDNKAEVGSRKAVLPCLTCCTRTWRFLASLPDTRLTNTSPIHSEMSGSFGICCNADTYSPATTVLPLQKIPQKTSLKTFVRSEKML